MVDFCKNADLCKKKLKRIPTVEIFHVNRQIGIAEPMGVIRIIGSSEIAVSVHAQRKVAKNHQA